MSLSLSRVCCVGNADGHRGGLNGDFPHRHLNTSLVGAAVGGDLGRAALLEACEAILGGQCDYIWN